MGRTVGRSCAMHRAGNGACGVAAGAGLGRSAGDCWYGLGLTGLALDLISLYHRYILGNPLFLYRVWQQARQEAKR